MESWLPTIVGLVAGGLSSYSLVPQVLKVWREGDTEAISKKMFTVRSVGLVLWAVYGFVAPSISVLIFSSLNLTLSIVILVLKVRGSEEAHQPA